MNAPARVSAAAARPIGAIPAEAAAAPENTRIDGWTAERRVTFLGALAEGHTVEAACGCVGLSVASAYALRRRAGGEAFALGWRAACLLARDRLADILTSRAIDGQVDTYTRADGTSVTRHRHDNRLATALLSRLDRLAASEPPPAAAATPAGSKSAAPVPAPAPVPDFEDAEAARLVAGDFAGFLDLVADDGDADAVADFLGEAHALRNPQLPQLRRFRKGREWLADNEDLIDDVADEPVWWDEEDGQWLTSFAPPPHFEGTHYGRYGEANYARTVLPDEEHALGVPRAPAPDDPDHAGSRP